jgi:hypothetical protein
MAVSLSQEEQLHLIRELEARAAGQEPARRSILDLAGLGQEIWQGIDAQQYVNSERDSWNR